MYTDLEYLRFAHADANLSTTAKSYVDMVRQSEPSRMVGTHARSNVVGHLPSTKMGRSISTESRGPEAAFFILAEYDDRIDETWDQPEPIHIVRTDKRGRKRRGTYTPDFLVLGGGKAELIEVKAWRDVERLAERYPDDWIVEEDGSVRYLPAEAAAAAVGLSFRVWVYRPSLRFLVSNIDLILRARVLPDASEHLQKPLSEAFSTQFAWTMEELAQYLSLTDFTGLIQALDNGVMYTDLKTQLLTKPEGCVLAPSVELVSQAIDAIDQNRVMKSAAIGTVSERRVPSQEAAEAALERLRRAESSEDSRSVRRWRSMIRVGGEKGLSAFQSLLPRFFESGNNRRKINRLVATALDDYLFDEHARLRGISKYRSYIRYRVHAEQAHPEFEPVHRSTFERRIARIPAQLISQQRGGKRAGNADADASDPQERQLRAQLPWQLVSIDHYLSDIYLIYFSSDEQVLVERPWITAMIDQATGSLLAVTVSFLSPSRHAVAKVFRECVRRHGRLPQEVILDRGSEFKSTYMASLLAHYEVGCSLRPASHPRYGSEVERFFGEFKQAWLSQRAGNLADYKEARSVDGKFSPKSQAFLRPADFIRELSVYRQWRENAMRGTHTTSSGHAFNTLSAQFPFIGHQVSYDAEFLMMTAVDTQKYKVDQRRGISVNGRWYYAPELKQLRGVKSATSVRIDPENPYVIFARVRGSWLPCYASDANTYSALDGPAQMARGLTQLETSTQRRRHKQDQDEELAKLAMEMDTIAAQTSNSPIAFAPDAEVEGEQEPSSWFEKLELDHLPPLKAEPWEVKS